MAGTLSYQVYQDADLVALLFVLDGLGGWLRRVLPGGGPDPSSEDEIAHLEDLTDGLRQTAETISRVERAIKANPDLAGNFWTDMMTGRQRPRRERRPGRRR